MTLPIIIIGIGLCFFGIERAAAYFLRDRVENTTYVSIRAFCGIIALVMILAGFSKMTMDNPPAMPTSDVRAPQQ